MLAPPGSPELQRRDWIAGLEKGLAILEAFDAEHCRMTASQVGQRCGLTRTVARRHLLTLAHLGYVLTDGKLYWLSPRLLGLGRAYLESSRLPHAVQPFLHRVTAGTGEGAYFAVIDHHDVVYVARSAAGRHIGTGYVLGSRAPAQVTAAGVVMLSHWPSGALESWLATQELIPHTSYTITDKGVFRAVVDQARRQGWFVSEQQLEINYRGIAVPVFGRGNHLLGAMSVTMPMNGEATEVAVGRILPVLQDTARGMRQLL
jgi:IclR family pca regulon transcriptional regulator